MPQQLMLVVARPPAAATAAMPMNKSFLVLEATSLWQTRKRRYELFACCTISAGLLSENASMFRCGACL